MPASVAIGLATSLKRSKASWDSKTSNDEEAGPARERFARTVNSHHLFDDESVAFQFAEFSAARVPEHAPLFVFGVYLLPQGTTTPSERA